MSKRPSTETRTLVYPKELCDPKRWLNFVQLDPFPPAWKKMGLTDDDLRGLEVAIMVDPERPPVEPGTGGMRKLRFAREGEGKRGGIRVCYAYFREFGLIALIYAFPKGTKAGLSQVEKTTIRELIREIERYLKRGRKAV